MISNFILDRFLNDTNREISDNISIYEFWPQRYFWCKLLKPWVIASRKIDLHIVCLFNKQLSLNNLCSIEICNLVCGVIKRYHLHLSHVMFVHVSFLLTITWHDMHYSYCIKHLHLNRPLLLTQFDS